MSPPCCNLELTEEQDREYREWPEKGVAEEPSPLQVAPPTWFPPQPRWQVSHVCHVAMLPPRQLPRIRVAMNAVEGARVGHVIWPAGAGAKNICRGIEQEIGGASQEYRRRQRGMELSGHNERQRRRPGPTIARQHTLAAWRSVTLVMENARKAATPPQPSNRCMSPFTTGIVESPAPASCHHTRHIVTPSRCVHMNSIAHLYIEEGT